MKKSTIAALLLVALTMAACERESRGFDPPQPGARVGAQADAGAMIAHYQRNAFALATGKRLFTWYNCNGCHAAGGGGSGPALMDDVWIYGAEPLAIYQTIAFGRPNGMPAFGKRVPEDQLWQLVAYVRSLSGQLRQDAAPSRADGLAGAPPENTLPPQKPFPAPASAASPVGPSR